MPENNENHKKYHKCSDFKKGVLIGRHKEGRSSHEISRLERVPQSTVNRIIRKYEIEGTYKEKPHNNSHKKLSPRAQRHLKMFAAKDSHLTLAEITRDIENANGTRISPSTVRKYLHSLKHQCPKKKPKRIK